MPTTRQKRILEGLLNGDLVWEIPDADAFAQFNERTGREMRIGRAVLEAMEASGWVERVRQQPESHKLDFWQLTPEGRAQVEGSISPADTCA